MFVLVVFKKGAATDPVTAGVSSMDEIVDELSEIEYLNLKNEETLSYILYNGYIKIIEADGDATTQGKYLRFKAQEKAKARSREELIKELEEKKLCQKEDSTD